MKTDQTTKEKTATPLSQEELKKIAARLAQLQDMQALHLKTGFLAEFESIVLLLQNGKV